MDIKKGENLEQTHGSPMQRCKARIAAQFPGAAERVFEHESMAAHSSFKVGGPADLVFMPCCAQEIVHAVQTSKAFDIPFTVLGNGSNILVSDKGIRGLTLILGEKFSSISREKDRDILAADSGALLSTVAKYAAKAGLAGMEFAAGIPGSIGGAVYMNAGAYDGCMADIVMATQGYDPEKDELFLLDTPDAHTFGYRQSLYEKRGLIILRTWLRLKDGDPEEIERRMAGFLMKRKASQPLEHPSAGSTFKRPEGHYAGRLIEKAGLKGRRIGGACVSPKHAGFIVNDQKATARDVMELIHEVEDCVYKECGVTMDPEVRILGEW